jgi:uncharacterized membrane protein
MRLDVLKFKNVALEFQKEGYFANFYPFFNTANFRYDVSFIPGSSGWSKDAAL